MPIHHIQSRLLAVELRKSFKHRWWTILLFACYCCCCCSLQKIIVAAAFERQHNNNKRKTVDMRGAWKSQGRNQRDLVEQLGKAGIIQTDAVQKVMERVDRGNYCNFPKDKIRSNLLGSSTVADTLCYADGALSIGFGQTISAPHMHAYALEEIYPTLVQNQKDVKILDVGCGSGYLTACFGRWVSANTNADEEQEDGDNGDNGDNDNMLGISSGSKVFGIDVYQDLVDMTRRNIQRQDGDLLSRGIVHISLRDGWKGLPEHAPFDAIHVGAAAESMPTALANQLKVGGIMIIPIGPQDINQGQNLYKVRRISKTEKSSSVFCEDDFEITTLLGVRYVPLVHGR